MRDTTSEKANYPELFGLASEQHGYFTAVQARALGISWRLLTHYAKQGRFIRVRRGLYRFRDYPYSPHEEIMSAWLAVGKGVAVVSHESALELLGLSDVIPNAIHVTVPRAKRHRPNVPGVSIHTTTGPLNTDDVVTREGIRLTSPTRTILDAAEAGTGPEQIEMAVRQAVRRGLIDPDKLLEGAKERVGRVYRLIQSGLSGVEQ
jgi:predicted transcriptional regulator of viral defense system